MDSYEQGLIKDMAGQLARVKRTNRVKGQYYEGTHEVVNVGFNVPEKMRSQAPHIGWAGIVVDALEERIQFLGWNDPSGKLGLDRVYAVNQLSVESGLAHFDSFIYGTGFVEVGSGETETDQPLVSIESSQTMTGVWDHRMRRLSAALRLNPTVKGEPDRGSLFLPDETISLVKDGGQWRDEERDIHRLGVVPVVMMPNRISASSRLGHSEISRPICDLVDEAGRVLLAMGVNREFFSGPQRVVMGATPDDVEGWKTITAALWTIEADDDGNLPKIETFPQVEAGPHIEQLKALATQTASVAGIPETYFGVSATANPSSADAIRASEVRLIKKAERRCQMLGMAWLNVAKLVCLVRDGTIPPGFADVSCRWADPATPTSAAKADEASKLVGAGILPASSRVTLDRIGLSDAEQQQVATDRAVNPTLADVIAASATRQTSEA
ncbi:MAG: phage portal protein [Propionibacteriaceae bacterium]|jgi:hypothetical protein|nr:phage portal protein [Propionibacteriaceae bacterium]